MSKVSLHPICIKNQDENNNILGLDTSELRFGSVQNLYLELETLPLTELFRSHLHVSLCLYHVSFRLNFLNKFSALLAKQSVAKMLTLLYLHPDRFIFVVREVISIQQNVTLFYCSTSGKLYAKYEIGESLTLVYAEIDISTNYNLGLGVFLLFCTGK